MKLSNQEIINLLNTFESIAEKDLPVKMTFDFYSIHSTLMDVYTAYVKSLEKLKKKHNVEEDAEEFPESMQKELKELLEIQRELNIPKLNKEELLNSGVELNMIQLQSLLPVIADGEY